MEATTNPADYLPMPNRVFQVKEFGVGVYRTSYSLGEFSTYAEAQKVAREYEAKYCPVNSYYRTEIFMYETKGTN